MWLKESKLLAALVLFVATLLCGYLPARFMLNQALVEFAMFAGGGVLMATAFCHLIPEAHDSYRRPRLAGPPPAGPANSAHSPTSLANATSLIDATNATHLSQAATMPGLNESLTSRALLAHAHARQEPDAAGQSELPYLEICLCCGFFFMYISEQLMMRFVNTHTHEHPCDSSTGQLVGGPSVASLEGGAPGGQAAGHLVKFLRGFLIISAFLLHSLFEGLTIGTQPTVEKVWTMLFAIACHKLIIAAVVGLELYATTLESHLWTLVHVGLFSLMSPIGIVLVVLAQDSLKLDENDPTMVLVQSFATGSVLYIVFVEILQPKEGKHPERNKLGKSVSLLAGFALMLAVLTQVNE